MRVLRALRGILRAGVLQALAYPGEIVVWALTSTLPLVQLALFETVAREAPLGRLDSTRIAAYFLATFVVRQLTSSWVSWQINLEVRDGTLATRLVRPVHPLLAYAAESFAALPLRGIVSLPVAFILLATVGREGLAQDPALWAIWPVSLVGAALLSVLVSCAIGALAFFIESSLKVIDVWLAVYFVLSGYLVPVELFPPALREVVAWLPFRYQIGLPVEIVTGALARDEAFALVGRQWMFVAVVLAGTLALWRRGLGRFAAYGG